MLNQESTIQEMNCAKALFQRQLTEYRSSRFFVFNRFTLLCLCMGICNVWLIGRMERGTDYALMVMGILCVAAVIEQNGKWLRDLLDPDSVKIPGSNFAKLWYATLLEYFRAVVEGALLILPCCIALKIPPLQTMMLLVSHVCLQAGRMYLTVILDRKGWKPGTTRPVYLKIVILVGIYAAAICTNVLYPEKGLYLSVLLIVLITAGLMVAAAGCLRRTEKA